jgi:hypothetical protein
MGDVQPIQLNQDQNHNVTRLNKLCRIHYPMIMGENADIRPTYIAHEYGKYEDSTAKESWQRYILQIPSYQRDKRTTQWSISEHQVVYI